MKEGDSMSEKKIQEVMEKFTEAVKRIYGSKLRYCILYGSCARGDFEKDSDIDVMLLLDVPQESIGAERKKILEISDQLDWDYDVVLAPVLQSYRLYKQYLPVSKFYQNVQKEGIQFV